MNSMNMSMDNMTMSSMPASVAAITGVGSLVISVALAALIALTKGFYDNIKSKTSGFDLTEYVKSDDFGLLSTLLGMALLLLPMCILTMLNYKLMNPSELLCQVTMIGAMDLYGIFYLVNYVFLAKKALIVNRVYSTWRDVPTSLKVAWLLIAILAPTVMPIYIVLISVDMVSMPSMGGGGGGNDTMMGDMGMCNVMGGLMYAAFPFALGAIVVLNIAFVYVFVGPLFHYSKVNRENLGGLQRKTNALRRTAMINLWLAVTCVTTQGLSLALFIASFQAAQGTSLMAQGGLGDIAMAFSMVDPMICLLCSMRMTTLWLPSKVRRYIKRRQYDQETKASNKGSSDGVSSGTGSSVVVGQQPAHQYSTLPAGEQEWAKAGTVCEAFSGDFVVAVGLAVFPLSILVTYLMLNETQCLVDQCTFDNYPEGVYTMSVSLAVYHAWLWMVGGMLYAIKRSPALKAIAMSPVNWLADLVHISVGETVLAVAVCALLGFNTSFWYGTFQDAWANSDVYTPLANYTTFRQAYQVSQQTGRLNEVLLGLSMLPVARNSVLDKIFDLSYVNAIAFHRVVGWLLVLSVAIHGSAFTFAATQDPAQIWASLMFNMYDPDFDGAMLASGMDYTAWGLGMWMNFLGVLAGLIMVVPATLSFPWVRRRFYNAFYFAHFMLLGTMGVAWLHATSNFYFCLPGLGLYLIDIGVRMAHRFEPLAVLSAKLEPGNLVQIIIDASARPELISSAIAERDVFVRLCFPAVASLEWHPFTVVQGLPGITQGAVVVYMSLGGSTDNDWCRRVWGYLQAATASGSARVAMEGPFLASGPRQASLVNVDVLVCFAGGAGVTPALATLKAASGDPAATRWLVWSVRTGDGTSTSFSGLQALPRNVSVRVHETSVDEHFAKNVNIGSVDLRPGRVNFSAALNEICAGAVTQGRSVGVFVSGPAGFQGSALHAIRAFEQEHHCQVVVSLGSFTL